MPESIVNHDKGCTAEARRSRPHAGQGNLEGNRGGKRDGPARKSKPVGHMRRSLLVSDGAAERLDKHESRNAMLSSVPARPERGASQKIQTPKNHIPYWRVCPQGSLRHAVLLLRFGLRCARQLNFS